MDEQGMKVVAIPEIKHRVFTGKLTNDLSYCMCQLNKWRENKAVRIISIQASVPNKWNHQNIVVFYEEVIAESIELK